MFHRAKTEKERQQIFDDYLLDILKERQVIKKNQKIIEEQEFSYDPTIDENKVKGAFNSYVDSLVVKNFLIEQIYSRLKISKSMAMSFVNNLNGNQILILSKVVNEFIQDIQDKYVSINDYILKTSFEELLTNYNVIQQQEKNDEIVRQNQIEQGQTLQENIPEELTDKETTGEEEKMSKFLTKVFQLEGIQSFGKTELKKVIFGELLFSNPEELRQLQVPSQALNERLEEKIILLIEEEEDENKERLRLDLQRSIIDIFMNSRAIPLGIRNKAKNLKLIASMEGSMIGSGIRGGGIPKDEYITIGKYKAHKEKLMGGKLQMRSSNNHQIHNLKSQNISKNIRDILLKLNKDEAIKFSDVDKLTTEEKDQLYMIGKRLHITQLFDIPSTLKSQEDKLRDEFTLLRGNLLAGNNNPDLLRKFKMVLLKMKNNKLVSLQEYNEILNILLEMDI